jgi:N,N'-diacetyl-8-epilegionaminate cytidylyltransferase
MPLRQDAVAFIFARGGSKGVARKNVRLLAGKPLIAHSILVAQRCSFIRHVLVSTEDEEIATIARQYGAEVPFMRPPELATDAAPEWLSWQHAIRMFLGERPSVDEPCFLSLPATCPFRSTADVEGCARRLEDGEFDAVVTVTRAKSNPYFTMVTLGDDGVISPVMPGAKVYRRQEAPEVYDITAVAYATRPSYILNSDHFFAGKVGAVIVPEQRALDIDTPHDFEIAEALAAKLRDKSSKYE